jgi:lipoate-protein ligase A
LGNLVFSFLLPHDPTVDFKANNTKILINAFKSLGIDAHFSGRNDILVEDKKVSKFNFRYQVVLLK